MSLFSDNETICAQSTARGFSGISVVRVSGSNAVGVARKVCPFLPAEPESHKVYYGFTEEDSNKFDEVLVTHFEAQRSFTGESVVEISGHGNPVIVDKLLRCLVDAGSRPAEKGEFTYRAFLNGRIDLVQAESVLGLIEGQSLKATEISLRQLGGGLSKELTEISKGIVSVAAHLEANIDYAAEDIVIEDNSSLKKRLSETQKKLTQLLSSYQSGRKVRDGVHIALAGAPNSGKSSLINRFTNEPTAIVSEIAGTTRDIVSSDYIVSGQRVCLFDTAGLRETDDEIETIGVSRAWDKIKEADAVFYLIDASKGVAKTDLSSIDKISTKKCIVVFNKTDLLENPEAEVAALTIEVKKSFPELRCFSISTLTSIGCRELMESALANSANEYKDESETIVVARHFDELKAANEKVKAAIQLLSTSESPEFISFELKDALKCCYRVTGEEFDDQIMDSVFNQFCLGK